VVVSQEVIEHVPYALQRNYLAKAALILRVGGYLVLTTPNARTLEAIPGGGRKWSDQPLEEVLSKGGLTRLLSEQFEIISLGSFIFGVGCKGSYRIANSHKLRRLVESVGLRRLWDSLLGRFDYGLHFIAIARKR
jgi:2-polyprenyl-3-methyl-5-hydroxy-6-metoxy-1,4-benzoquinol methylase